MLTFSQQGSKLVADGIPPPADAHTDGQGFSVGISGNGTVLVTGARQNGGVGGGPPVQTNGEVFVWKKDGAVWTLAQYISAPSEGGLFGNSVAISDDGTTIIIGAPAYGTTAYIYVSGPELDGWSLEQEVNASDGHDGYGYLVDISADGNTAVVATFSTSEVFVWTRTSGTWSLQETLTGSGKDAVSISGDGSTISFVGHTIESEGWVYGLNEGTWDFQLSINSDFIGQLALSYDGNTMLATETGGVIVYERVDGDWSEVAAIDGLEVDDAALSDDGTIAAFGNPEEDTRLGALYIAQKSEDGWSDVTRFTPTDWVHGDETHGRVQFGFSVDISPSGQQIVVGGHADDLGIGAIWVFAVAESAAGIQVSLSGVKAHRT